MQSNNNHWLPSFWIIWKTKNTQKSQTTMYVRSTWSACLTIIKINLNLLLCLIINLEKKMSTVVSLIKETKRKSYRDIIWYCNAVERYGTVRYVIEKNEKEPKLPIRVRTGTGTGIVKHYSEPRYGTVPYSDYDFLIIILYIKAIVSRVSVCVSVCLCVTTYRH